MLPFDAGSVAVDTNVIIYALDRDTTSQKSPVARHILRRAGRFPIRIPLQVVAESFSVLTKRYTWTTDAARAAISQLLTGLPHVATTAESTRAAMELCTNHHVAFWDALLVTAAAAGGCGAILSEDFQDRRRFDPPDVARRIVIVDPFNDANREILQALGAFE